MGFICAIISAPDMYQTMPSVILLGDLQILMSRGTQAKSSSSYGLSPIKFFFQR